jgi:hypothetical protein
MTVPNRARVRSLAHALRRNRHAFAAAQNGYKQNVIVVNTYVTTVMSSKLPSLNTYPPDWNDFVSAYETATSDALNSSTGSL